MDNIKPPPNSSPEEIQAWNNMMDTMVTFIKASTHLMNTITTKVRSGRGKSLKGAANLMGGCEPECEACQPKPPCGICKRNVSAPILSAQTPQRSKVQVATTPSTPSTSPPATAPQKGPADGEEGEALVEGAGIESPTGEQQNEDAPAPSNKENSAVGDSPPSKAASTVEQPASSSVAQDSSASGDQQCICAVIRAKRAENEEKKGTCQCRKRKKKNHKLNTAMIEEEDEGEEETQDEEPPEILCGCGPTAGNRVAMVQEMVEKLAKAQQEINELQEEMARLQRMDASKRTGPHAGPNPAALYREIMRDNEPSMPPPQRVPPHLRQRLFQNNNSGCVPCEDQSRGSPNSFDPRGGKFAVQRVQEYVGNFSEIESSNLPRQMMRPSRQQGTPLAASTVGRAVTPTYYPGLQAPCRRTPSSGQSAPESMGYMNMAPTFNTPPQNSDYWSRLADYGSQISPTQRIICPSAPRSPPTQESPPRRRIICGPPQGLSTECDPDCENLS